MAYPPRPRHHYRVRWLRPYRLLMRMRGLWSRQHSTGVVVGATIGAGGAVIVGAATAAGTGIDIEPVPGPILNTYRRRDRIASRLRSIFGGWWLFRPLYVPVSQQLSSLARCDSADRGVDALGNRDRQMAVAVFSTRPSSDRSILEPTNTPRVYDRAQTSRESQLCAIGTRSASDTGRRS